MNLYYQKHRTIKALQFDGTIQQLRDELPPEDFERFKTNYNLIKRCNETTAWYEYWDDQNHIGRINDHVCINFAQPQNKTTSHHKYHNILHKGDYLIQQYRYNHYEYWVVNKNHFETPWHKENE